MTRAAVLNAFTPSQEVLEPALFAGRRSEVLDIADALALVGANPLIFGDRGLGKTSLAVQSQLIAMGDSTLLEKLHATDRTIPEASTFFTVYIQCTDDIQTFSDLQLRIVHALEEIDAETEFGGRGEVPVDRQTKRRATFKIFEFETTKTYVQAAQRLKTEELSLTERIRREAQLIFTVYGQPLLIIIDELDRVRDTSGLASLVKALSGAQLKFVLVGVAQSLSELIQDHESVVRSLSPIHVRRMGVGELADIVDRAISKLDADGLNYRFTPEARTRLVRLAGGFPWFVHVIGQAALTEVLNNATNIVTEDVLIVATRSLINNRFAQHFRDGYQRAVKDSYRREILLRLMAAWKGSDIPTSMIYQAASSLGVSNPATYKGHLLSEAYGSPLMAPSFQTRGLVRFRNEMFKQYVNLTGSLFAGVEEKVARATQSW